MSKFKVGDRIKYNNVEYVFGGEATNGNYFAEVMSDRYHGWSRDNTIPDDYKSVGVNQYYYVFDGVPWELVEPTKQLDMSKGNYIIVTSNRDEREYIKQKYNYSVGYDCNQWCVRVVDGEVAGWSSYNDYKNDAIYSACTFVEASELMQQNAPQRILDGAKKLPKFSDFYWCNYVVEHSDNYCITSSQETKLTNNKQTTMNRLTSAIKRVLSKDKQTLYKAGFINGGLDLSGTGRELYVNALFQNEGDHAKAVAEMVESAEEQLEDEKSI